MDNQLADLPGIIRGWASDQQSQGLIQMAFNYIDYFIDGARRNNGLFPDVSTAVSVTLQPEANQVQYFQVAITTRNWLQSCQGLGVLDASIEALNKQRPVQGLARVGVTKFMQHKFNTQTYLGIIQNSQDAKNILRQFAEIGDQQGSLANTNADDYPRDAPTQRYLVRQLYDAMVNYDSIIESKVRDRQEKQKMNNNYQVRNVMSLSPLELETLCWRMLERAHDAQNGVIRAFPWNKKCTWKYRRFPSFMERWAAIVETCKASKAAVHQMMVLDTTTRLAGDPSRELNTKMANKALNANRDMQVRAGIRVLKKGEYDTVTVDGKRKLLDKDGNELEEGVPFSEGLLARRKTKRVSRTAKTRKRVAASPETDDDDDYENDGWYDKTPPKRQKSKQTAKGKGKTVARTTELNLNGLNIDDFNFDFTFNPQNDLDFGSLEELNVPPFPAPELANQTHTDAPQFLAGLLERNLEQSQVRHFGNYAPPLDRSSIHQLFPSLLANQIELNVPYPNENQDGGNQQSAGEQVSYDNKNQQDAGLFEDYYNFLNMPLADAVKDTNQIDSFTNPPALQQHEFDHTGQQMATDMVLTGPVDTGFIDPKLLTLPQDWPTSNTAPTQPGASVGEPSTGQAGDMTDEMFALELQQYLDANDATPR